MQTTGLILNPTIWSRSQHPQPGWWSHLAPTTASNVESTQSIFCEVTEGRWGKVMGKPLANRVTVGRTHEHTHTHSQSVLTSWLLLPDTQASTLFVKVTVKGITTLHLCVWKNWQQDFEAEAVIIHQTQDRKRRAAHRTIIWASLDVNFVCPLR